MNDLGRNVYLRYLKEDSDYYDGLKILYFEIEPELMWDQWHNTANIKFGTEINGTSILSPILSAESVATKGHYYTLSPSVKLMTAVLVDKNNTEIEPDKERDDTLLGIE